MKTGGRIALGVGAGYLLGRTRKMRLALMIAAAGATGTVGSPRQLVQRGLKQLASSQELGTLTEVARGQLMNAAKAAAVTAASSRIDSLNERLQDRSGGLGKGLGKVRDQQEDSEESTEENLEEVPADSEASRAARGEDQDTSNRGQPAQRTAKRESAVGAGEGEPGERERPATRQRASTRAATRRRSSEESEGTSPRRGSRTRTGSTRTPVRRTGR